MVVFPARGGRSTNVISVRLSTDQRTKISLHTFAPNMGLELTEWSVVKTSALASSQQLSGGVPRPGHVI